MADKPPRELTAADRHSAAVQAYFARKVAERLSASAVRSPTEAIRDMTIALALAKYIEADALFLISEEGEHER